MNNGYGLWPLVILHSAIFIVFAFSFTRPKTPRDWRSFGAFSAFIVALFTEMYGFPLTIYLLSGWLSKVLPGIDIQSHNSGHLLEDFFGWGGDPHLGAFHMTSYIIVGGGVILLRKAWDVLYRAQQGHALAITGPYAKIRHPQYAAFILIMLGFLFQWPTLLTVVMFPILVWMYMRLAKREDKESQVAFGKQWNEYADRTPMFIPGFGRKEPESPRNLENQNS